MTSPFNAPCSPYTVVVGRQATYADGLWNGRPLRDWVPDVVADVVAAYRPARVIVYGSVARGDERESSDLDLLVLFDGALPAEPRRLMGEIRRTISAPIPIDVLVGTVAEFEARKDDNGSPYYWPAREGHVVHERPAA